MGPVLSGLFVGVLVFALLLVAFGSGTGPLELALWAVLAVAAGWGTAALLRRGSA